MNKTFIKLGMIVAFMLSFLTASAYDFEVDGIYYTVTDFYKLECKIVKGDSKYEGGVVIPSTVNYNSKVLTVVAIGSNAFDGCSSMTSVKIPDSVTSIGQYAFRYCSSLTSLTIPDSVTSIGYSAFYDCGSLTRVTIGNSVTTIGSCAFEKCSSLMSVTLGSSITSIDNYAFKGCRSLTSVPIPESLRTIGIGTFENCSSLTSVTIPNSVRSLGNTAFRGCTSLEKITLSENLYRVNGGTFCGCLKLESIIIPGTIHEITQYADYGTNNEILTFSNLKKLVLSYSEEILKSSYFYYYNEIYKEIKWDSNLTYTLEEVFFDRQMVYDMPLPNVKTLSFGEHLKEVQVKDIEECEKLETIVCYGTEPPYLPSCSNKQYMNVVVKVPQEALEKYQQAKNWKNFWNLQEFDPSQSSVDEIPASSVEKVETGRFNLNGQRVGEDYQGIVIVRYSDGSTRKLMTR